MKFGHEFSSPYYPQENGQVEVVNKTLKTILQRMVGTHKMNWQLQLYSALWSYRTLVKIVTRFTPFQLVYGLEAVILVACEIPSLQLVVELLHETTILHLIRLEETRCDALLANEAHKNHVKVQYEKFVCP